MKRFFLFTTLLAFLSILFMPTSSPCVRYIDEERGICYDDLPKTAISPEYTGKHKWLITIDGMDPLSSFGIFYPDMPTIYLFESIEQQWREKFAKKGGVIVAISWSRDIQKTDSAISKLRELIKWCNARKEPITILSHSWGTVIAYITLQQNPKIKIEKLITLGSPLSSQSKNVFLYTKAFLGRYGLLEIKKPNNTKAWHNFFNHCDPIASNITGLPKYSSFSSKTDYGSYGDCHSAYFLKDKSIWTTIQKDSMDFAVQVYDRQINKSVYVSGRPGEE